MIIYGTRSAFCDKELVTDLACPHCGEVNTTEMYIYRQHVHIFWIPTLPFRKYGVTVCSHCKKSMDKKEFTPEFKKAYQRLAKEFKGPLWQFSGLFIMLGIAIWFATAV